MVDDPWPMSAAEVKRWTRPSGSRSTRTSAGFESAVFPIPYHIEATPSPSTHGPSSAGSGSSRRHAARTASSVSTSPTLPSRTWPVPVWLPSRRAFRSLSSIGSSPSRCASRSMAPSVATATCGVEKPRIAPAGGLFEYQRAPRAWTWGTW